MTKRVDEEQAIPNAMDDKASQPEEIPKKNKFNKKQFLLALGMMLAVAAITVGIAVPLSSKDSDDQSTDPENPSTSPTGSGGAERPTITAFTVFNGSLPVFNSGILTGYASEEELAQDLSNAARLLLDRVVARNLGKAGYENLGFAGVRFTDADEVAEDAPALAPGVPSDLQGDVQKGQVGDVNDHGTNNQEEGVEEGDKAVANANTLFTAYGDYIIAWNTATGNQEVLIHLPPSENGSWEGPTDPKPEPPTVLEPEDPPNRRLGAASQGQRKESMIWPGYSKPWVQSMILLDTKLIVVAGGYEGGYIYPMETSMHVLTSINATRVFVYDVSVIDAPGFDGSAGLVPISFKDLNGYFVSARAIGNSVHVVTNSGISYYDQLVRPLEKYANPELSELSDEAYIATVVEGALNKYIPNFVSMLMDDLRVDGNMPSLIRLSTFDDGSASDVAPWLYPDGYLSTVVQTFSFNASTIAVGGTETTELTGVSVSGAILPAYGPQVYATQDDMIIATSGTGYSEAREVMVEKTYLVSFKLDGTTVQPHTIGSCLGTIINQYSMDVLNGVLRVATTLRKTWFVGIPEPMLVDTEPFDDGDGQPETGSDSTVSNTGVRHLNTEEPEVWEESTTENYVLTMSIDGTDHDNDATTPAVMEQLDILRIGKEHETITAVRFYNTYAYAVTFQQIDPFYKLDVSDPFDIKILAEVEITGFSRYLQSIDENDEVIVALGQETDMNGMILGLQLSVFDMRINEDPKVVRHLIEIEPNVWSHSDALWDKNAFRRTLDRVMIPVNKNSYPEPGYFDGFMVFVVSATSIEEDESCSVNFWDDVGIAVDRYCGAMAPRAMVFGGSMVSMKGHSITRKDLDTCVTEWERDVSIDSAPCYVY